MAGSSFSAGRAPNNVSDALSLHPSDHPGLLLVSKVFNGNGYGSWKRAMELALTAKKKLGFVTGSCKKPSSDSEDLENWEVCNSMVISWILNGLSQDISESVVYMKVASDVWQELEERFGQANGPQFFQIQQELSQIRQGSSSITAYYTRIKKLWDEIQSLSNLPPCTCGLNQEHQKLEEKQRLMQLLMGLNESYLAIRGHILLMKPLPTVREVYALLIQEERQREINSSTQFTEAVSLNASSSKNSSNSSNFSNRNSITLTRNKPEYKRSVCDYCKRVGHTKDKCFKLHGFPTNYKNNKEKRIAAPVQGNNIDFLTTTQNAHIPELTTAQLNKLMDLLNDTSKSGIQQSGDEFTNVSANANLVSSSTTMAASSIL
ncbi:uncharacterized protein LOC120264640 isoform X2 [Dioscorea cayenensis subsp. rotundata]|uniref:Uncharacterized protein LOC120264640 isoform X2 n=1 Tax=Dioscorea cayennensis subsp. rotundata TaxID=55577 RepID=A0AB40BP62_DIOCR|nr:uncharacterized protein LOC120264640 isoform X2 [Dioscorea cayenensis subsp. rotundata]